MRALNISAILLLITSLSCIAGEVGDAVRGKELSAYCMGCHGEYGVAPRPSTPNLAGQNKEYLEYALKAYRDGTLDFPGFARHSKELKCNSKRGSNEQGKTIYTAVQRRSG
jgi:cytochrome c553